MPKHLITPVIVLAVVVGCSVETHAQTRSHDKDAKAAGLNVEALSALDDALQTQIDDHHVAGVIGLIGRHGKIGYFEAFGSRNIDADAPMNRDSLFRIYSMTKPIVAVTAMQIWEEGKFKLDDPISNYCPEWTDATVKVDGKVVAANKPLTARHLMTHSAGLSYAKKGLEIGDDVDLQTFSESLAKQPLKFQPGTSYVYGYAIDILGRYIEAIEGKPLDEVMRERIFDKLGMDDTEFWIRDSADQDRAARVYMKNNEGVFFAWNKSHELLRKPARMMGGQGLVSTAGDYAKFCQMLLGKGKFDETRILKASTVKLMSQNHLKDIGRVYGLGGSVNGKGRYSWGGAAGTGFWVDATTDTYAVFMIQRWGYKPPTYGVFKKYAAKAIE
jgi:CubicO group peptidase (beta-lactamase class C family)